MKLCIQFSYSKHVQDQSEWSFYLANLRCRLESTELVILRMWYISFELCILYACVRNSSTYFHQKKSMSKKAETKSHRMDNIKYMK